MNASGVKTGDDAAQKTRRGGWMMIVIGWAAALMLAVAFFGGALESRNNPNNAKVLSAQGGDELVLLANAYGHYYAEGTMNGENVLFLLDTGATQIAVPESIAGRVGLTAGHRSRVNTANGIAEVHQTAIDNITIGNISISDLRGAILPNMDGDAILLGMNALGKLNMSQQDGKLRLSLPQKPHLPKPHFISPPSLGL